PTTTINHGPLHPESGHLQRKHERPLWAKSGHRAYSITSSARASSDGGTKRPSAFAVVRFTTRSNLVGCSIGRSAGFAPRSIWSTKSAPRRKEAGKFGP